MSHLTTAEKSTYAEDGLVVPSFRFSTERVAEIAELLDVTLDAQPDQRPESIVCPHITGWNDMPAEIAQQWLDLCTTPEVMDIAEELIGPDVILWGSQIFCKPAQTGLPISWHQDGHFWPIRPLKTLNVWLAIEDVTVENGCMQYIPGSHSEGRLYPHVPCDVAGEQLLEEMVDPAYYNAADAKPDELEAGQFSLHDTFLIHGSEANRSQKRRAAFVWRMIPSSSLWDRELPSELVNSSTFFETSYATRPIFLCRGDAGVNGGELLIDLRQ